MIAPLRETDPDTVHASPHLREAHRFVASTLLSPQADSGRDAPPVPAWKAWLFTVWVVVITAAYCAFALGWL